MNWQTTEFSNCYISSADHGRFRFRIYNLGGAPRERFVMYVSCDGKAWGDFKGIESTSISDLHRKAELIARRG